MSSQTFARGTLWAAIALGSMIGTTVAVSPGSAQNIYNTEMSAGREAYDGSSFQLAERHFQAAFEAAGSDGQKATAMYSLAVIAQKTGRIDEAKDRAQKALDLSPKNSQAKRLLDDLANAPPPAPAVAPRVKLVNAPEAKGQSATKAQAEPAKAPAETVKKAGKETPKETAAIPPKGKEAAPSAKLQAPAPATAAAASTSAFDASTLGTPEPNGVRLIATLPAQPLPVRTAGFSGQDRAVTLLTGPADVGPESNQAIEIKSYDLATGTAGDAFTLHSEIKGARVAMPPSSGIVATAVAVAAEGKKKPAPGATSVHIWDIATVDNKHAIEMTGSDRGSAALGVDLAEFSRDGKRLVIAHKGGVEILDANGLRGVGAYRFNIRQREGATELPLSMAVSNSASRIVLTMGPKLRLVEASSVKDVAPSSSIGVLERVAITDNGRLVAVSSGSVVRLIEPTSGKIVKEMEAAPAAVTALAFSPAGDRLAVASVAAVQVWSLNATKGAVSMVPAAAVERIVFSADGKMLLAAGQKGSRVWFVDPAAVTAPEMAAKSGGSPVTEVAQATPAPAAIAPAASSVVTAAPAVEVKPEATASAVPSGASPELVKGRANALAANQCEVVKALDAQIGDQGFYDACNARLEQARKAQDDARRNAERGQRVVERKLAVDAVDCEKVKALDAQIGDTGQLEACSKRLEARQREADRVKFAADHKAAREALECDKAKEIAGKLGIDDTREQTACRFDLVMKTGSARELYLTAAKHDADRDRGNAKKLYRAIVERFPQDELALKAAERMTVIADLEASESTGSVSKGTGGRQRR